MNTTENLKLPQYTEEDIFDLQDINKAYDSIDKAYGNIDDTYKEVVNIKDEIPKTNATAEVINARGGKETLGKRFDEFGSQLDTSVRLVENNNELLRKKIHFSIDDFGTALADITINENKYNSIFENKTFAMFKELHEKYGFVFSCYCYTNGTTHNQIDISTVTTKFRKEFEKCSDWLKFGFHGKDNDTQFTGAVGLGTFTNLVTKCHNSIKNFAGEKSLTTVIRTQNYLCSADKIKKLRSDFGLNGLMTPDGSRGGYDLTDDEITELDNNNIMYRNMYYFKTNIRLEEEDEETLPEKLELYKDNFILGIFTHEYRLTDSNYATKMRNMLNALGEYKIKNGYTFSSLDVYGNTGKVVGLTKSKTISSTTTVEDVAYTLDSSFTIRSGQSFSITKHGNIVSIEGQLTRNSAITNNNTTILTIDDINISPKCALVLSAVAFGETVDAGIPIIINPATLSSGAKIVIGWKDVVPNSKNLNISLSVTFTTS